MSKFTKNIFATAVTAAILGMTAPVTMAQAEEPVKGGTFLYASVSSPKTLDPHTHATLVGAEIVAHIYESLVSMGSDYSAKPMLADNWEISEDGKTYTFNLRKGVHFHNGDELTSADVLATFERYYRVSPGKALLEDVKEYRTPDPHTFIIELNKASPIFIDRLKTPVYPLSILPASQKDIEARMIEDYIGTGPFKMVEWVKDSHLITERFEEYSVDEDGMVNDGYVGKKIAHLDAIRFNFIPEGNARVAAMQTGEAHSTTSLPLNLLNRLKGKEGVNTVTVFPYCQQYIVMNSSQGSTKNVKVRRAIRQAMDIEEMIIVSGEVAGENPAMMYEGNPYYNADTAQWYGKGDVEGAKALLKESGYNGEEIVFQSNNNYTYMRDTALLLGETMKAAGMNVRFDITDWATNSSNLASGDGGWNVSTTSFCSPPILGPQTWQSMILKFPQIEDTTNLDANYDAFYNAAKLEDRVAAWKKIEGEILGDAYMLKVSDRGSNRAYSDKVGDYNKFYINTFYNTWLKN